MVDLFAYVAAIISVVIASSATFTTIFLHLRNYRRPDLQRSVIRILLIVPVYGIASVISLSSSYWAYYIDTVRDVYEGVLR